MKMCLHQFIRPGSHFPTEGRGNCCICLPDEENKHCRGYYPIGVSFLDVEEKKK